jgi:Protein of unknown function (DUF2459)
MHLRSTVRIALPFLGCLLVACASTARRSPPPPASAQPAANETTTIYLVRRKWHIDVGFAAADLQAPLSSLTREFPGASYLLFGFGDRHYLLAKNKSAPNMLGALWPGAGIVLVTALKGAPAQAFDASQVIEIRVPSADAQRVQIFIWDSLSGSTPDRGSTVTPYGNGPYAGSLYYSALPRYSALHTCNTWVAEALQAGGLGVPRKGVIFAGRLWRRARGLAAAQIRGASLPAETR